MRASVLVMIVAGAALLPGMAAAEPRDIVVFFTQWSAQIDQPANDVIRQAAEMASAVGSGMVTVTGFADTTGSARATALLSATRAQVVVDRLVDDGIDPLRIQVAANGGTSFVQAPLENHRVTIGIAIGPQIAALPGKVELGVPAEAAPTAQ